MLSKPDPVPVWLWVIIALLALVVTPITVALIRMLRNILQVKEQVVNDHNINMRDEQDDRHAEVLDRLSVIDSHVQRIDRRTERIGNEVIDDRKEMYRMRSDMYAAIRRADESMARHHPEDQR